LNEVGRYSGMCKEIAEGGESWRDIDDAWVTLQDTGFV
jgi:hypothetical protein